VAPDWSARVDDHALALDATWLRDLVERAGVKLVGYRALRELQRSRRTDA